MTTISSHFAARGLSRRSAFRQRAFLAALLATAACAAACASSRPARPARGQRAEVEQASRPLPEPEGIAMGALSFDGKVLGGEVRNTTTDRVAKEIVLEVIVDDVEGETLTQEMRPIGGGDRVLEPGAVQRFSYQMELGLEPHRVQLTGRVKQVIWATPDQAPGAAGPASSPTAPPSQEPASPPEPAPAAKPSAPPDSSMPWEPSSDPLTP